jgi:PKD repeat protein
VTQRRTRVPTFRKPDHRRSGALPGRRLAVGLCVCLGTLALAAGGAAADDSGLLLRATVHGASGAPTSDSASVADLQGRPGQCPLYTGGQINEQGRTQPEQVNPATASSWTLGAILGCLQPTPITLSDVTGVTVTGADGAPQAGANSQITPADLRQPDSDFLNPAQNPVVWWDGNNRYDRPQRDASDLNFLDQIIQSSPITVDVFEGPLLTVNASPRNETVTVGDSVRFSATVSGGTNLTYNWDFGGGAASSTLAAPEVQFNTAGVWTVNVEVTDANGGGGGDQTTVTVNQPGTSSTPTSTGPTTTGPNKSSGTTPNAPPSTKKPKTGTHQTGTHKNHGKGQGNTSTHTQTSTTSTTTTPTTSQTTTTPAAGGSSGGFSGSSGSPGATASPTTPASAAHAGTDRRARRAPTHRPAPTPAQGTLVRGELVSDIVPLPADRSPLVHLVSAQNAAAPARQAPVRRSVVLPIIGAILAVLLLLSLGAQRELGWPRWWRNTRWWRRVRVGH